jgi:hypothetical protein
MPAASYLLEVAAITEAVGGGQHEGQAESFARPLARRAVRIARPARVRMRSRNPCVFARRRLFGWNVRLLTGYSACCTSSAGTHGQRCSSG